jgi:hypothetical protein
MRDLKNQCLESRVKRAGLGLELETEAKVIKGRVVQALVTEGSQLVKDPVADR